MSNREWIVKTYCRLVNDNICFIQDYFEGIVPAGRPDEEIYWKTKAVGEQLRALLEEESIKEGKLRGKKANYTIVGNAMATEAEINRILGEYLEFAVNYFEKREPWNTIETNRKACRNTILNSWQLIANLTVWLDILGEAAANKALQWLELDTEWKVHSVHSGLDLKGAEKLVVPVISCGA